MSQSEGLLDCWEGIAGTLARQELEPHILWGEPVWVKAQWQGQGWGKCGVRGGLVQAVRCVSDIWTGTWEPWASRLLGHEQGWSPGWQGSKALAGTRVPAAALEGVRRGGVHTGTPGQMQGETPLV